MVKGHTLALRILGKSIILMTILKVKGDYMPYIKKTYRAGKTIEVVKCYSSRYGKAYARRDTNHNPTPKDVAKVNQRHAEDKLRRIINANFGHNDIHNVLTYEPGVVVTPEQAKKDKSNFLRKCRRRYKKLGIEFKYIIVTETGKKSGAIHHHIIMSSIDLREIRDLWTHGQMRPTFLNKTGEYGKLANYIIKQSSYTFKNDGVTGKRWYGSTNLVRPEPEIELVGAKHFRKTPTAEKGYYIEKDSVRQGIHEVTGMEYQFYRMIRME